MNPIQIDQRETKIQKTKKHDSRDFYSEIDDTKP